MPLLLEFVFSNHRSFRDEACLSMRAAEDNTHGDALVDFAEYKFLRSALLFGANGSGKSNVIDALCFVRDLVCTSVYNLPGAGIRCRPHPLDGDESGSSYLIQFASGGSRFAYGLTVLQQTVSEEYLYCYPDGEQTTVFERFGREITWGDAFHETLSCCQEGLQESRLLLSCVGNCCPVREIEAAYRFFAEELVVLTPGNQDRCLQECLCQMGADESLKAIVLQLLQDMDTGIRDIAVQADPERETVSASTCYNGFSLDLCADESRGVQKMVVLACLLTDAIRKGNVLVVDDLDAGLHESLVCALMKWFVQYQGTPAAQLIAATQETMLLDMEMFRRDQIWFLEMDRQRRTSKLYSLIELIGVGPNENAWRWYRQGKYGARPELRLDKSKQREVCR